MHLPHILSSVEDSHRSLSPPPSDLLDEDPFQCQKSPPTSPVSEPGSGLELPEKSHGSATGVDQDATIRVSRVRRASSKPAIRPRPSLPSISSLAQMNIQIPTQKVPKGHVGARLPSEPWDDLEDDLGADSMLISATTPTPPLSRSSSTSSSSSSGENGYFSLAFADDSIGAESSNLHSTLTQAITQRGRQRKNSSNSIVSDWMHEQKYRSPSSSSSEDDYGAPHTRHAWHSESSDDDVPLAQSIPTALTAQKSIRKKVREERAEKRRAKAAAANLLNGSAVSPTAPSHLRPVAGRSVWHDTVKAAQLQHQQQQKLTLQTQPYSPQQYHHSFNELRSAVSPTGISPELARSNTRVRSKSVSRPGSPSRERVPPLPTSPQEYSTAALEDRERTIRRQPSQHQSGSAGFSNTRQRSMSVTRSQAPTRHELAPPLPTVRRSSEDTQTSARRPSTSSSNHHMTPAPPTNLNAPQHTRPAPESMIMDDKMIKALMSGKAEKVAELRRERSLGGSSRLKKIEQQASAPPPPVPSLAASDGHGQIRVFIGDMQRYQSVTVTPGMTASNLISFLESQGVFKGWVGLGQWVLFEQAQDLGMERPIRPFEILKPAGVGGFLVRMHDTFGLLLSSGRVPEASPVLKGWVEWELKKGKWNKKWLELREHGLWIAKKDGAASELLCSLTSFDVYTPTSSTLSSHKQKAPKPYIFALKSVDPVTYFEDKNDYMHTFCCKDEEGEAWVESILLARSYILHQERHILNSGQNELKRRPTTATTRPNKKLVADSSHSNRVFASGSLLRNAGGGVA